jgi:hypothetical protein
VILPELSQHFLLSTLKILIVIQIWTIIYYVAFGTGARNTVAFHRAVRPQS